MYTPIPTPVYKRPCTRLIAGFSGLTLTASTELEVVKLTSSTSNLSPSASILRRPELAQSIPPLLIAIETQSHPTGDVFQCQTCLASIHWLLSEPGLAASRLPRNAVSSFIEISRVQDSPSDYTTVCMMKSIYMKASCLSREGDVSGSLEVLNPVVRWMHEHESNLLSQPQLLPWSERLLAYTALTASGGVDVRSPGTEKGIDIALQAFRHWAIFSAKVRETKRDVLDVMDPGRQKIETWKAYYLFLSKLLQCGIDHHVLGEKHTRLHQVTELRRVESAYEVELLRVSRFPKAHKSNPEIEDWVEQVIRNLEVLSGTSWPESELGEGGRDNVRRNVLEILYRAATKTFHSTLILRHLFQVHQSLAEFSLAYKALDSYLELVIRGKARAKKSRDGLEGLDDDETVMRTTSEGIEGLCKFGRKDEVEKAFNLTIKLEQWVQEYTSRETNALADRVTDSVHDQGNWQLTIADARTLEIAHRAIGIGTAFWAMWTPTSEQRITHQSEALASLQQASVVFPDVPQQLEIAYAQALLLAETRDLKRATECVKRTLTTFGTQTVERNCAQQRKMMPFFHLLALLLSARQDMDTAYQMCGAAFDQFSDTDDLFGSRAASVNGSMHTSGEKAATNDEMRSLIDDMNGRERERIIEIRITELALIEFVQGPEEAVNGTKELLSLFSKFFGHLIVRTEEKSKSRGTLSPRSVTGSVKSFRGSIFGRKRREASPSMRTEDEKGILIPPESERVQHRTYSTEAPTIQITDEDLRPQKERSHWFRRSHSHNRGDVQIQKLHKRLGTRSSINLRDSKSAATTPIGSVVSSRRQSFETGGERLSRSASTIGFTSYNAIQNPSAQQFQSVSTASNLITNATTLESHNKAPEAKVSLRPMAHNIDHADFPPPLGHDQQPPQQDIRLPVMHPPITFTQPSKRFPPTAKQIHAHRVLTKIWLLIATLYRRAFLFEDSVEACGEASRSASQIEALVADQESSASAFADPGWGGGKSSSEVWADVCTERALLALAKGMPHDAITIFEEALMYSLDHPAATVGLCNILLDIYEQKIPGEPSRPSMDIEVPETEMPKPESFMKSQKDPLLDDDMTSAQGGDELRGKTEDLNRLAARDRAYGLLSSLTKLGTSWDDSEAWYALARAHECGGQVEKAKEVLWWCVELEDKRPVRHWRNIGPGTYVL